MNTTENRYTDGGIPRAPARPKERNALRPGPARNREKPKMPNDKNGTKSPTGNREYGRISNGKPLKKRMTARHNRKIDERFLLWIYRSYRKTRTENIVRHAYEMKTVIVDPVLGIGTRSDSPQKPAYP